MGPYRSAESAAGFVVGFFFGEAAAGFCGGIIVGAEGAWASRGIEFAIGWTVGASCATFFAGEDRLTQLLAVFSVFAAGYLARPLGAIVIGMIGDRRGRSTALTVSRRALFRAPKAVGYGSRSVR